MLSAKRFHTLGLLCGLTVALFAANAVASSTAGLLTAQFGVNGQEVPLELDPTIGENGIAIYTGQLQTDDFTVRYSFIGAGDPIVAGFLAVQNNTGLPQDYALLLTQPIAPAISPSSLTGGSIGGSVTDGNQDGATFSSIPTDPVYQSYLDGVPYISLLNDPFSTVAPTGLTQTIGAADFGSPIPSLAGPPVSTSIGVGVKFRLSAHDVSSLTFNFVVIPVPEPAALTLAFLGAFGHIAAATRRK